MNILNINDNSQKDKTEFLNILKIVDKVADKTLNDLEKEGIFIFPNYIKESKDLTDDQMILQSYNNVYRTSNVMGILGCNDERLVIKSRFSCMEDDYFFKYLLEHVFLLPNIIDLEINMNLDNQLFSFFVFIFPQYLKNALRKGLFKTYVHRKYNNSNLKGTINIARHIQKNTPFIGNIAYSNREYSYDNYLTELIRHTIEVIKTKPYGNRILSNVKEEINLIIEATPNYQPFSKQKIINENKKNVIRHAYFHEYRLLQYLCLLILQNQKHQFGNGINQVYGILFDGAWLWEEYINLLVKDKFYHPMNKGCKGAQRLFDGNIGLIYPDFISKNNDVRIIADAKYKPIENINNRDYFQIIVYMMRFDAKTGICFYPESKGNLDVCLKMNKGITYEKNVEAREDIKVIKQGLKIPNNAKNYKEFSKMMKESENEFLKNLI